MAGQCATSSIARVPSAQRANLENGSHNLRTVTSAGSMMSEAHSLDAPPAYTATAHEASSPASPVAQIPPAYQKRPPPLCFICHPDNQAAINAGSVCSRFDVKEGSTGHGSDAAEPGSTKEAPKTICQDTCGPWSHFGTAMSINWKVSKCTGGDKTRMQSCCKIYSRKTGLSNSELQKAAKLLAQVRLDADDAEAILKDERWLHSSGMDQICAGRVKKMLEERNTMLKELHERAERAVSGHADLASLKKN
ncbi:unnamed protein product [Peniophora sp. CBMAI 1063]|nr:unnamed protein product [Peniophora sp. CBMAI 1063]